MNLRATLAAFDPCELVTVGRDGDLAKSPAAIHPTQNLFDVGTIRGALGWSRLRVNAESADCCECEAGAESQREAVSFAKGNL